MRNRSFLSMVMLFMGTFLFGQEKGAPVYHDINGDIITKKQYIKKDRSRKGPIYYFPYWDDSQNYYLMTWDDREVKGKVDNVEDIYHQLEKATGRKVDPNQPLVILYYPGEDESNSSGSSSKDYFSIWHLQLENRLFELGSDNPFYIARYFDKALERYGGKEKWIKDPNEIITKSFFSYHYPGRSFTVLNPDGSFFAFYGEFGKEQVWEAWELMN